VNHPSNLDRLKPASHSSACRKINTDLPQGGIGSIKLARLAISLEQGKMKIIKAKGWRDPKVNPCGLVMEFKFDLRVEILA